MQFNAYLSEIAYNRNNCNAFGYLSESILI